MVDTVTAYHLLNVGDDVYLTPKTLVAPRAAWRRPACRILAIDHHRITVRITSGPDTGTELTTTDANILRNLPRQRGESGPEAVKVQTELPPPETRQLCEGVDEIPLF